MTGTGWINVKDHGARGDGGADDTQPMREAVAELGGKGGTIHFPPGEYRMDAIDVPAETTLLGDAGWSYTHPGPTVLKPVRDDQPCLFRVEAVRGTKFVGLSLCGENRGKGMHGIQALRPGALGTASSAGSSCREMGVVVDNCSISLFTGSALHFRRVWVWMLRHSLLGNNRGHGMDVDDSYDGWMLDTTIAGNDLCGLRAPICAATTITGSRIEWNHRGGIVLGPQYVESVQIANCHFDACFGPAVAFDGAEHCGIMNVVTGSVFRRNGYQCTDRPEDACHLRVVNQRGLVVSGNTFLGGRVNPDVDESNPDVAMQVRGLQDSVIQGNAMYHGAMKELIRDLGGHTNLILRDHPGSLQAPAGLEI